MTSETTIRMARDLKRASRANGAPIWARLSELALKPTVARRVVNVNRLGELTKDGDVVAFAGKVLGTGSIGHKITLFAFSVSATAAGKVLAAGGRIVGQDEIVRDNPTGKGVLLLG